MKSIQQTGAWFGVNQYGRAFEQLKPKQQLQALVSELGNSHLHRGKTVGIGTIKARASIAHQALNEIRAAGFDIRNLLTIDQRHITAVVNTWIKNNLSASTIQTRFSVLKWLATGLGKRGLIQDSSYYGVEPAAIQRTYVAQVDKSWSSHNVISADKIAEAKAIDIWVGHQLDLMAAFGLRITESVMIRPKKADHGDHLCVEEGTKGGRTRIIPIDSAVKRKALDEAKELALRTKRGSMCPPNRTVKKAVRRIHYVAGEKLGITKAALGVTPHGLRHEYANDKYEAISGNPSIVRGGTSILDRALDERARHQVTQDLGHARLNITAAYTGPRIQGRPKAPAKPQNEVSPDPESGSA